jgi:hypothetical protein
MKILTSIPALLFFLSISLAGMEKTPEGETLSFMYAISTVIILTLIMFKAIFSQKRKKEAVKENMTSYNALDAIKGNLVGKAEDGTEYYLIKMKGNAPVKV